MNDPPLPKLVFVVPALDERDNLPRLAERLAAARDACGLAASVVLVDDGSTDGTGDAAREILAPLGVRVVTHQRNLGVAAAFRSGFAAALESCADHDLVVTLEADNTSDVAALPRLVDEARRGADLVLGSCYAPGGGVEGTDAWRWFVSACANGLVKTWFGLRGLHTFSSFYRVHRAGMLREVFAATGGDPLRERGFASVVELLVRVRAMGFRVAEVPVVLRSHERQGRSKMRIAPTVLGYFRVMAALGPFACRVRGRGRSLVAWCVALASLAAVAAWLRLATADGREIWYDDIARIRAAFIGWPDLWRTTPWIDNLKSPYLTAITKLWWDVAGTESIGALRGAGTIWGVALVVLTASVARQIAGAGWGLAAAAFVAVNPFDVRWSIEVHNYAPAAAATLVAWRVVLGAELPSARRAAVAGAFAGLAVGMFPPAAFAVAPVVLLPAVARASRAALAAGLCVAAVVAAPALVNLHASSGVLAEATRDGRIWSPYFHPWRTSVEMLVRMAGVDLRQGAFRPVHAAWVAATVGAAAVALALLRTDAPDRRRRLAAVASAVVPLLALGVVSRLWIGVFNDRYLHSAACMVPIAIVACVAGPVRAAETGARARARRIAAAACVVLVAGAVGLGLRTMFRDGARFPRDLTARSYRGADLLDRTADAHAHPDAAVAPPRVFVHGESQCFHVLLRSRFARAHRNRVAHLATAAWVRVLADRDVAKTAVPQPYGWPFAVTLCAGRAVTQDRSAARDAAVRDGEVWLLFERPPLVRQSLLEEDEVASGTDAAWRLSGDVPSPERDAAIADAIRQALDAPPEWRIDVTSQPPAALVRVRAR